MSPAPNEYNRGGIASSSDFHSENAWREAIVGVMQVTFSAFRHRHENVAARGCV
jgi:hypothetical protein